MDAGPQQAKSTGSWLPQIRAFQVDSMNPKLTFFLLKISVDVKYFLNFRLSHIHLQKLQGPRHRNCKVSPLLSKSKPSELMQAWPPLSLDSESRKGTVVKVPSPRETPHFVPRAEGIFLIVS